VAAVAELVYGFQWQHNLSISKMIQEMAAKAAVMDVVPCHHSCPHILINTQEKLSGSKFAVTSVLLVFVVTIF
jgi:hypothetical protein